MLFRSGTETTEPTLSFYTSKNVPEWVRHAAEVEEETKEEQIAKEEREYQEAIRHMHELEETMVEIKWIDPVTFKGTSMSSRPSDWDEEKKEVGRQYPFGMRCQYEEVMQEERKRIAKQRLDEILMEDWSGPESVDTDEESEDERDEPEKEETWGERMRKDKEELLRELYHFEELDLTDVKISWYNPKEPSDDSD